MGSNRKKIASVCLAIALILTAAPMAFASIGGASAAIPRLRNATLIETSEAGPNGVYKTYIDATGRFINARETSGGFVEFAYNDDGVVHTYEYQDGNLRSHTVLSGAAFEEEVEELSPSDEAKLEEVLSRKVYESLAELQAALQQAGISAYVYVDTDGDFVVDPFY